MARWVLGAFAAAALVVVVSASAQVVVGRTAYRVVVLPHGGTKAATVSCPAGFFALSGGAAKAGDGVAALATRPVGVRGFAFRLTNGNASDQKATVAVACRRVRPAGKGQPFLKLSARRHVTVSIAPSSLRQVRITCPSGTVPAAPGFDLGRDDVTLRQQTQDLHALTFGAFNNSTTARKVSFYGSCLTVVHPAGVSGTQLQLSLATDTVPIPTGSQVQTRVCPRRWLSLGVGYSLPAGLDLNGAAAIGLTGRWSLTNPAGKPLLAQIQLACARVS